MAQGYGKALPIGLRVRKADRWLPEKLYREHLARFPLVTIDIVVTDSDSRFLLLRRNERNVGWRGTWATPGGRIFRNERLGESAHRILMRETGLNIPTRRFTFAGVQEIITREEHSVTTVFRARTGRTRVVLDDTSSEAKWFKGEEAPANLKPEYRSILSMGGITLR